MAHRQRPSAAGLARGVLPPSGAAHRALLQAMRALAFRTRGPERIIRPPCRYRSASPHPCPAPPPPTSASQSPTSASPSRSSPRPARPPGPASSPRRTASPSGPTPRALSHRPRLAGPGQRRARCSTRAGRYRRMLKVGLTKPSRRLPRDVSIQPTRDGLDCWGNYSAAKGLAFSVLALLVTNRKGGGSLLPLGFPRQGLPQSLFLSGQVRSAFVLVRLPETRLGTPLGWVFSPIVL